MRSNDGTSETVTTIETNTVTTSRTVDLDLTSIRLETFGWIFGGDTTLDGVTTGRDAVLCEAELLERSTSGNLYLSGDNIDTSNLLGDCVLYLTVSKV